MERRLARSSTASSESSNSVRECDGSRPIANKATGRATRLGPSPMASFIPPQFSAPPKDGNNIKPSEYLKRVHSNSALAQAGVGSESERAGATKAGGGGDNSASSSGVSSKTSTPNGSLSSSTGAALMSRFGLASKVPSEANSSGEEGQSQVGSFGARQQQAGANRFKQFAQKRTPFFELNRRSQSTSALNKLDTTANGDEYETERSGYDNQKDENVDGDGDDNEFQYDDFGSAHSSSSTDGTRQKTSHGGSGTNSSASSEVGKTSTSDDIASNLMNELKNFDRAKLLKNQKVGGAAGSREDNNKWRGVTSKLGHLLDSTKRDLIAELKESRDLDGIKRMRDVYKNKNEIDHVIASAMPVFKAEDFLDRVAEGEPELPLWRRQMLAKKAADRARKEHEEKLRAELKEKRLSQVPQWKREMMAKKAADRSSGKQSGPAVDQAQQRQFSEMPTWRRQLARIKLAASTGHLEA